MVEVGHLKVKYSTSSQLAVSDVSFSIKPGEVLAVMGPSGCGKTTIINALSGLFSSEEAEIEGKIHLGSEKVSIVFQEPRLIPWRNVYKNISFGLESLGGEKEIFDSEVKGLLQFVGLEKFSNYLPRQLSLGMQQRVNFVRALAPKPKILLMDEPFSSLDKKTAEGIKTELKKIIKADNITVLLVTHQTSDLVIADRVIHLTKGPAKVKATLEMNI